MRFIMMVEMTSWAPKRARSTRRDERPRGAGEHRDDRERNGGSATTHGSPRREHRADAPTARPATASCPSAPMLKSPARSARSTATPVKSSGVAL